MARAGLSAVVGLGGLNVAGKNARGGDAGLDDDATVLVENANLGAALGI